MNQSINQSHDAYSMVLSFTNAIKWTRHNNLPQRHSSGLVGGVYFKLQHFLGGPHRVMRLILLYTTTIAAAVVDVDVVVVVIVVIVVVAVPEKERKINEQLY